MRILNAYEDPANIVATADKLVASGTARERVEAVTETMIERHFLLVDGAKPLNLVWVNYTNDWLTLIGGLYYGWDSTLTNNTFNIGSVFGPGVNGGFFQHFQQTRESYAAFAQGDITLTDKLILTLGIRYTVDHARYGNGYADLFLGNVGGPETPLATTVPCPGPAGTCAYDPTARFTLHGSNSAPTGRVALSYTFDDKTLVYASFNHGYRSGAINGGGYTSSSGITYIKPETVNAYEAGLKGHYLDDTLSVALAGFRYDYENQQLQDTRSGPVSFLVNAPRAQSYGFEAEASWSTNIAPARVRRRVCAMRARR